MRIPLALLAALGAFGCESRSVEFRFILPVGYRGPFVIATNQADGERIGDRGVVQIHVPTTGILKLQGDGIFLATPIRETAAFENGVDLPVYLGDDTVDKDLVQLKGLFTRADGTIWYFVGTAKEAEAALKSDMVVGKYRRKPPPD
jgi:hypothetical protein